MPTAESFRRDIHWTIRQQHHDDIETVLRDNNMMDSKGHIRRFDGRVFREGIEKLGHDMMGIDECRCSRPNR